MSAGEEIKEALLEGFERFEIGDVLGRGAQRVTYRGLDRQTGEAVAIKELILKGAEDWKSVELFDREARALRNLRHPAIPRYVDAFHVEEEGDVRFFLIQELIEGENLQDFLDRGEVLGFREARKAMEEILEVLVYLQELHPPVIHRDLKPSNLILRPDGSLAVIDFGAVEVVRPSEEARSTMVGTTGFMPPEQLIGRTTRSSDLYALGATMVYLMGGIHPSKLPMEKMKLSIREVVWGGPVWVEFVEMLLEPVVEDRIETAREALDLLRGKGGSQLRFNEEELRKPAGSHIQIRGGKPLYSRIRIPTNPRLMIAKWSMIFVTIFFLAQMPPEMAAQWAWLILVLGGGVTAWLLMKEELVLEAEYFEFRRAFWLPAVRFPIEAIRSVEENRGGRGLVLRGEEREVVFGRSLGEVEREWLLRSLRRAWERRWKERVESEEVLLDFGELRSDGGDSPGPANREEGVVSQKPWSADESG